MGDESKIPATPQPAAKGSSCKPAADADQLKEERKERFEKNRTYAQVGISVMAFILSIVSLLFTADSNRKTAERQQEVQAYNYWQNFLQLCVQKPEMANGDDSGFYEKHKNDSLRVQYAWFVANALGAAEIVFRLQQGDKAWRNTLKEIIGLHSKYITSKDFDMSHYSGSFLELIKEAVK